MPYFHLGETGIKHFEIVNMHSPQVNIINECIIIVAFYFQAVKNQENVPTKRRQDSDTKTLRGFDRDVFVRNSNANA